MKTWLRLLLVLATVGGGFAGLSTTTEVFGTLKEHGLAVELVGLTSITLYAFVIASGLLFVYDSRLTGPMLVAFALQIPWVSLPLFGYHFAAASYAVVTLGPPQWAGQIVTYGLSADLGAYFKFRFAAPQEGPWSVGINLFAVLLYVLLRLSVRASSRSPEPASTLPAG
jgi:hypothetical protein